MACHLPISQQDLAPKPNLVKPLQNQVPKYPFALSDAILFCFACLSCLSTPIQYSLQRKPPSQSLFFLPSPQMKVSVSSSLNLGYRTIVCLTHWLHHVLLSSLLCSSVLLDLFLLGHSLLSSAPSSHSSDPNTFLTASFNSVHPASPFSSDAAD